MGTYVLKAEPGHYSYKGADIEFVLRRISDEVDARPEIPASAKKAVKDFILERWKEFSEYTEQVVVNIPDELLQYTELILDIIKAIFGVG